MHILNIVTSPRKEKSASTAIVNAFLSEYREHVRDVTVDSLDIWQEQLPEFDAEAINAKYKGVSGEPMTQIETATWEKIRKLASRFQRADRIVLGVPMWNFSFPYKFKQLIDLSCQRNMLFTFDGKFYGPSLSIDKAFVAYVRGQSDGSASKLSLSLASNISAVTLSFGCSSLASAALYHLPSNTLGTAARST